MPFIPPSLTHTVIPKTICSRNFGILPATKALNQLSINSLEMDGRSWDQRARLQLLQRYRLLHYVHENNKERIKKMLEVGVEYLINLTEPRNGTGALHLAAAANNQDLVIFLLSQGAQPNIQDKRGRTPVMLAAEQGHDAMVELLAKNHADLRLLDTEGKGVLFYCIHPSERHARCLQVALHYQADVNNVSVEGIPVFQLMCEMCVEYQDFTPGCLSMLDRGADPNATNQRSGVTVLMEAVKGESLPLVRAILQRGGNPNVLDRKRLNVVHYAAKGGFFEILLLLSAYSADMGVRSEKGDTPLHYAAATGNVNCCKFLAQRGCNPRLRNLEGLLPRQFAKDSGHKKAAKILRRAERQHRKDQEADQEAQEGSREGQEGPREGQEGSREAQGQGEVIVVASSRSKVWDLTLHDWSHEHQTALRNAFGDNTVSRETFISVLENLKAPVEPDQLHTVILAHDEMEEGFVNVNKFIEGIKYIKKASRISTYFPKKKKLANRRRRK
ncbi:ankyrin repeat and EF-hand domain-containing protein 1-like [Diretmus argenteus]